MLSGNFSNVIACFCETESVIKKLPKWYTGTPWRHIPVFLQPYYTKDKKWRQKVGMMFFASTFTGVMAAGCPDYGMTDEEKQVIVNAMEYNRNFFLKQKTDSVHFVCFFLKRGIGTTFLL